MYIFHKPIHDLWILFFLKLRARGFPKYYFFSVPLVCSVMHFSKPEFQLSYRTSKINSGILECTVCSRSQFIFFLLEFYQ